MKACVETYGCTMNQGEGRDLQRRLAQLGYEIVGVPEDADIAVINTCVVIKATELKILKRLRYLDKQKKKLVITGCMASVMSDELFKEFPRALILSPRNYDSFENEIMTKFGDFRHQAKNYDDHPLTAIVPIAQGCLGNCSYCITKKARGGLDSRPMEMIEEEVLAAIKAGSKEILLTAQDTASYGRDIGTDLPELLHRITRIPGDFKVRVGMMNPDTLRSIMKPLMLAFHNPKVYKFLHLPVQTGSDRLLSRMNRRYSVREFEQQVWLFRSEISGLTLSTDIIVGFPGETDEDHAASMDLMRRIRPNIVNITRFSPRPGTSAAAFKEQVVSRIAKERSRQLARLRFQIASEENASKIGEKLTAVAVEEGKNGTTIFRDDRYIPIVVTNRLPLGSKCNLLITGSAPTHLWGKIID
ncbi:MAG: tRNA (N(6)-L-threonylcarbamoyladenosine(37)-C(2))-methylthiotransferase [Methanomassiliicoccales archaeon]